ncbi:hypothetical protein M440DRAFT_1259821 [Trichoderma longibrachiatum ATCC 18648]|uniref:Uncharacterized protein n=1 Tax=Trichoderma longibrachiatum ATCC 18648 TaxID=983965 RepID=A0A2T4C2J0_TRILO|nr:hypothetical protein M440DRAFT_1259821 [Trichoderma longibrachiatum ATCC 18648]
MAAARLQRLPWSHVFFFFFPLRRVTPSGQHSCCRFPSFLAVGANPGEENDRKDGWSLKYCIPAETEGGKYRIQTRSRLPGAVPLSELQTDCAACDGHGMNIINARIVLGSYTSDPCSPDNRDALRTYLFLLSLLQSTLVRYDIYTR